MFVPENTGFPHMPEFVELPPIAHEALSVVLLAADDAAHLEKMVAEWVTHLNGLNRDYEVLLVDDGSADGTAKLTAALTDRFRRVKVLRHTSRQGEGAALRTGLAAARYPLVFYTLCDPRYQPANLRKLLAEIDKVHVVGGYRAGRPVPAFWRVCGAVRRVLGRVALSHAPPPLPGWLGWKCHAGGLLVRLVFGVRNEDAACPYRLLRREILTRMPLQSDGPFAHVELLAKATFLERYLGEDVPLGDRARPFAGAERDAARGSVFADALRVFRQPDFGPPPAVISR
jgi:glycosyltransferase involved in cell wall biosynthesis